MTRRLAAYSGTQWKEPAIVKRQGELERQAAKIWPRKLVSDSDLQKPQRSLKQPKLRLVDGKLFPFE